MSNLHFPESELILNADGSIFHLHLRPEQIADKIILVGDPGRVNLVAQHFETRECEVESREFRTITGTYKGKRLSVISTGIGCDNIDIVINELDGQYRFSHAHRISTVSSIGVGTPWYLWRASTSLP